MTGLEKRMVGDTMMTRDQVLYTMTDILKNNGFSVSVIPSFSGLFAEHSKCSDVGFSIAYCENAEVYATANVFCDSEEASMEELLTISQAILCAMQAIAELERLGLFRKAQKNEDFV